MKKIPLSRIIVSVAVSVVAVFILTSLVLWTAGIRERRQREELTGQLRSIAAEGGPSAVLSLAGFNVENIFYGEEGLILFEEGNSNWLYSADELQNIRAYEKASVSVVEIYLSGNLTSPAGCGVVISSDGYIVTNTHVVSDKNTITVKFRDGSEANATLVGQDSITDIAVIKVNGNNCIPASFNSASNLVVGQKVIAIGSPYGYSWTQSVGTVSALERTVTSASGVSLSGLIQTDAQINPGNSGGPLLDGRGNMIGLITAIYSTSGSAQGISFAIPVDTVVAVASELIRYGEVTRGTLDIKSVELNPVIVDYANLPVDRGILVSQVIPGGLAENAGLRGGNTQVQYGSSVIYLGGDIITALDDTPIEGYNDYYAFMAETDPGDRINVTVNRNGQTLVIRNVELVAQTVENMRWLIR